MALEGFTIGAGATPAAGAPAGASAAPAGTALKGFSIGTSKSPAAPAAAATTTPAQPIQGTNALKGFTAPVLNTPTVPFAQPANTKGLFDPFLSANSMPSSTAQTVAPPSDDSFMGIVHNTIKGIPEASGTVSKAINDTVIGGPAKLLQGSKFMQEAAAGIDAGSVSGNFAQNMLQKLSIGLNAITGVTGGAYQTPQDLARKKAGGDMANALFSEDQDKINAAQAEQRNVTNEFGNPDILDKGLTVLTKGIGMGAGIGALGSATTAIPGVAGGIASLSNLVGRLPLVGKYLAPYVAPLVENAAGFAEYGQLDPKLAGDLQARGKEFLKDIATAPLYTALGAIRSAKISLPVSFGLGFGMAKLNGASNEDAVSSGLAFSFLDAFGRMGPNPSRGMSQEEMQQKMTDEALKILQPYAKNKLTADSSAAEVRAAYHVAAHQTHPDVGGTAEKFNAVKNAYDLLSKGTATPETTKSIELLSGSVKEGIKTHGELAVHEALKDQLGVDDQKAQSIIDAAQAPSDAEAKAASDKAIADILGQRSDEEITTQSNSFVDKNLETLTDTYLEKHGNVVGADEAKEFVPGYPQDRSTSDLVQKAASKISENAYNRLLDTKQDTGNNTVLITAGGTGAGKSTSIKELDTKKFPVVFDTNLSNAKGGIDRIQRALDKGYNVDLRFTYTRPDKAYDRVLDRAEQMTQEKGSGRPVSAQGHLDMHHGSHDALPDIIEHFKKEIEDGRVGIRLYDNSGTKAVEEKDPLDFINNVRNNRNNEADYHSQLNEQRRLAFQEGRISEKTNRGFNRAEALRPRKEGQGVPDRVQQGSKKAPLYGLNRGFVNPNQVTEDIAAAAKRVKDLAEHIENVRQLTGDIRDGIYQHENARKAMRVRMTKLIEQVGNTLDSNGWENLYHYDENNSEKLTPQEQVVYDKVIVPLKEVLSNTVVQYRAAGGTITPELYFMSNDEYTPRFAKDKQSALDKLLDKGAKAVKSFQNGGSLSKSMGTVSKSRKFYAATDESGARKVVYVPTNKSENVLTFNKGKIADLGKYETQRNETILNDQIKPFQEKIRVIQNEIETLESVKTRPTGAEAVLRGIEHKALELDVKFLDTPDIRDNKTLSKDSKKLKGLMHDIKLLSKVKPSEDIVLRDKRINTLKSKMVEASNAMAAIEAQFDPNTLNQRVFKGADGTRYTIGQATTKEIEANTSTEYHKNALANYVVALDRAVNALNATKLLERLKDEAVFGEILKKDSPDEAPPEGWKSVGDKLPQFRGYHMEARLAEALTDLASRQAGYTPIIVVDQINNFLTTAILLNPIMHMPNVISGRAVAAAAGDISSKSFENLATAIKEVRDKGPLYLDYLEHGAPFMNLKEATKKFADAIFEQYAGELEKEEEGRNLAEMLKLPFQKVGSTLRDLNEGITWGSNDILFMHALLDYRDSHGGTMEDAVKEVSKRMADYRIPERILLPGSMGRALSLAAQSRFFMFGRFHYSGVIKPWLDAAYDSATGTTEEKLAGIRALAYMLIMGLMIWPYINKMWQGVTGSPTSYESMPGPLKPIESGEKLVQNGVEGIPAAVQSLFTPSPVTKSALELGFNVDLFTRNPIYGPLPAEGLKYGVSVISPLASASRMTPSDFGLSMFGVWTPKNVDAKNDLQQMKYDELPALQAQVKKDIAAGNDQKASDEMLEYNNRAVATWNMYQKQMGTDQYLTTPAQKQAFLKDWGIKEPGIKALANAAAHYGDGSLTNKSSLLDTVTTYAKAIGVSPAESFHLMFSGQSIARVTNFGLFDPNSAIIVQRASLDYTEPIKKGQEADQGLTDQNSTLELDHVVPLEAGGTNDESNLNLITTAQNMGEQHTLENALGAAVKAGTISQAKVREYAIRYKIGIGETLPDAMMQEFDNKYAGQPMTLKDIQDAIASGAAK